MVQINFAQKQINAKVVYYGPGMSGKTTNLEVVHQRAPAPNRGDLTSISTDGDRTLFFDYMPLDLGTVSGMRTCFQMYTVPGQVYYNSTRKLVLQGVDGVIFVADSQESMREQNIESLKNLEENLAEYGKSLASMPLVIQYNKRDLPDAVPVETLDAELNQLGVPSFEAVANTGQGVFPTLKALAAVVLKNLSKENSLSGTSAYPAPSAVAPKAQAPKPNATGFAPPAPAPAGPAAGAAPHGPVSVPLTDTNMVARADVLPDETPAPFPSKTQRAPVLAGTTAAAPHAKHAAPAAPHGVASAPQSPQAAPVPVPRAPRARPARAGAQRQTATRTSGRRPAAPAEVKKPGSNMLYTGVFIVLATAVGAVLAKAILSFL
jgi:hypothetical protein